MARPDIVLSPFDTTEALDCFELHHLPEHYPDGSADATFVRVGRYAAHPYSTYLTLFAESDDAGTPRLTMNLWPEMIPELIEMLNTCYRNSTALGEE
jgi:hypothetical protein